MKIRFTLFFLLVTCAAFAGNIQEVSEQSFDQEISSGTVIVDFYGPWCPPCKRLTPVLESLSEEMKGKVTIVKVNIDSSPNLMEKYEVRGVPTLIVFKDGKEKKRAVGYQDKSAVKKLISG
ncbi:MAG: Thioredoxin [Chlamydiae bacterium]|nr:Thioredoxin [Chlamydiota bacterium]